MSDFSSAARPSRRRFSWAFPILGLFLTFYLCFSGSSHDEATASVPPVATPDHAPHNASASCPELPGMEDIFVILKTGVTEALDKVPTHLQTTLRCVPNYVIFSDHAEEIAGVQVLDVLRGVSPSVKQANSEFDLYTRILAGGRAALTPADLNPDINSNFGKPNNPGWKLDKWKFLPMIDETLSVEPKAKWYVFMEADTYFVWPNLLAWLEQFNSRQAHYLGNQMQIGDVLFAHGGSGFVLSHAAMRKASSWRKRNVELWDEITHQHWAGDCALGQLLADAGIGLRWSWPTLQNAAPAEAIYFNEGYGRMPWCHAPVTFHHLTLEDVEELWELDRRWNREGKGALLFRDVFQELVQSRLVGVRHDWINAAPEDPTVASASMVECRAKCLLNPECVQYTFEANMCRMSTVARPGSPALGASSAWLPDRIEGLVKKMGSCYRAEWVV